MSHFLLLSTKATWPVRSTTTAQWSIPIRWANRAKWSACRRCSSGEQKINSSTSPWLTIPPSMCSSLHCVCVSSDIWEKNKISFYFPFVFCLLTMTDGQKNSLLAWFRELRIGSSKTRPIASIKRFGNFWMLENKIKWNNNRVFINFNRSWNRPSEHINTRRRYVILWNDVDG